MTGAETKIRACLDTLTRDITDRCTGSAGNRRATNFVADALRGLGWRVETQTFDAIDWSGGPAQLTGPGIPSVTLETSPMSLGCDLTAPLKVVETVEALKTGELRGALVLLRGEIAKEQLFPKNFPFFQLPEHQEIIAGIENSGAAALICATGRDGFLAGGAYPAPMIEDGDIDVPSVFCSEEDGSALAPQAGAKMHLVAKGARHPATASNVIARRGPDGAGRIVVTAHADAKKGVPGALDNATGVACLLALAELLSDDTDRYAIEIVALNGEDYYSAPGQMAYLAANSDRMDDIVLNINVDGVGYVEGPTAYSFYDLPPDIEAQARDRLLSGPEAVEGTLWPQGDHSMFVQAGRPAIAVTSHWLIENPATQAITHTMRDTAAVVDPARVAAAAQALAGFVRAL